jgi:hypothetical protein
MGEREREKIEIEGGGCACVDRCGEDETGPR